MSVPSTGRNREGAETVTRAAGLSMVLWSGVTRATGQYRPRATGKFASVIRKRAALGLTEEHPVILLHDGGGNREATIAALQEIINDTAPTDTNLSPWTSRGSRHN